MSAWRQYEIDEGPSMVRGTFSSFTEKPEERYKRGRGKKPPPSIDVVGSQVSPWGQIRARLTLKHPLETRLVVLWNGNKWVLAALSGFTDIY